MTDEITPKEETVTEAPIEPISEPAQASEPQTDQIPVSEPLSAPTETLSEPEAEPVVETISEETKPAETEIKTELKSEPEVKPEISEAKPNPEQETKSELEQPKIIPVITHSKSLARELLVKARNMIQSRKRKKLDKIMTLFLKKQKITNDEVEKFLHVSDATATRYLSQLEKEGKIMRTGKTGKSVFYSKI